MLEPRLMGVAQMDFYSQVVPILKIPVIFFRLNYLKGTAIILTVVILEFIYSYLFFPAFNTLVAMSLLNNTMIL